MWCNVKSIKHLGLIFFIEAIMSLWLVSIGIIEKDNNLFAILIVLINSIAIFYFAISIFYKKEALLILIFYSAYLIRMVIALHDTFSMDVVTDDVEDFRASAEKYFYFNIVEFQGQYSFIAHFFGLIYKCFGIQRILLQHFNIIMMIIAGSVLY